MRELPAVWWVLRRTARHWLTVSQMSDESADREATRHIPEPIRRAVLVEAGHRCAVTTCRTPGPLEIHHIIDFAKGGKHEFANLIALCRNDHHRATIGEIDRLAMRQYKANLAVINSRYGDFERRILELFASTDDRSVVVDLPSGRDIDLWYLLRDGMIWKVPSPSMAQSGVSIEFLGQPPREGYALTEAGRDLVTNWALARPVE